MICIKSSLSTTSNMDRQLLRQKFIKILSNKNINTGVSVVFKTKRELKCQNKLFFWKHHFFLLSLLRIFDGIFDVIIDDPYLTQQKDSANQSNLMISSTLNKSAKCHGTNPLSSIQTKVSCFFRTSVVWNYVSFQFLVFRISVFVSVIFNVCEISEIFKELFAILWTTIVCRVIVGVIVIKSATFDHFKVSSTQNLKTKRLERLHL